MTGITIERDGHTQQFVILHNHVVRDKRLTHAARGLLAEILSFAPGTQVTIDALAERGPEGRHAIGRMFAELEKAGYVKRPARERDERGRWVHRLIVRETPAADPPEAESPAPENQARCDQQEQEFPQVASSAGSPAPENLPIKEKTEEQKTVVKKTEDLPPAEPAVRHPPGGRQRATRLPEDFAVTDDMIAWAHRSVPALIAAGRGMGETEKFRDYWRAASGARARKCDWAAAWRNWLRRADEELSRAGGRGLPGGPRPSTTDQRIAQAEALKAELAAARNGITS